MARIEYKNDVTRALEEAEGSDGRMNVDARSGGITYHNSKHLGQTYAMTFEHLTAANGEYSFYMKNDSTDMTLVVSDIGVNSVVVSRLKLWSVTGTATGAGDIIPRNMNLVSSLTATGSFKQDTGGAIGGITTSGIAIDDVQCSAGGHEELRLSDRLRLGQGDAIALEVDTTAGGNVFGVVFFYYE